MADDDNEIHREYYSKNTNSAISAPRSEHLEDHHILAVGDTQSNALPPSQFILSFQNLTYTIRINKKLSCLNFFTTTTTGNTEHKVLLNDISGEAIEGEIMAVLGASGSGKSTLIDALANRISRESLKGSIKLNGEEIMDSNLNSISAYVMQDDLLFPMLTVEETLLFSAEFRLPRTLSKSQKKSRVETLIDQLGLRSAAKTVIGDEGHRGVSGGERRRVSIGTDIIHDPIILFLDEPTSGLDSTSAYKVVQVLQRIAQSGSIVIMSIHQPSYRVLRLLDGLIFLSRGQTVYSGSPGNLPEFFAEFGHPIPENENRAEFALDLIKELEDSSEESASSLAEFNQSWQDKKIKRLETESNSTLSLSSSLHDAIKASISTGKLVSVDTGTTTSMTISSSLFDEASNNPNPASSSSSSWIQKYANPFWIEAYVIGKRSFVNSRRMPEVFGVRFVAILITSIVLATIFWNLDDSPKGAKERLAFIAFAMSTAFYICAETLPRFLQERYIYMRETRYNAYRQSSYVLSHAIISIPSLIILSLIFAAVTFWSVGLSGGSSGFLYYFCIIVASFWAGSSFVTFLSGVVPDVITGYTVSVATLSYYVLFSGFFIIRDRIPVYWIWYHYISLVKYPYEGALHNEFDDPNKCFGRGVQMFDETLFQSLPEQMKLDLLKSMGETLGNNITSTTCILKGSDVLNQAGINELSKWNCLLITIAWGILFRFLFYIALLLRSRNRR